MVNTCHHHWLIGELAGLPKDQGRCKFCGATRAFPTVFVELGYNEWGQEIKDLPGGQRDFAAYIGQSKERET